MGEYWGAQVEWPSFVYGTSRYIEPSPDKPAPQFTMSDTNKNNGTTIDAVRRQILAQHPEKISALADQWQNALNLLSSVREQLYGQSDALSKESWNSPAAKEAFLQAGPGKTLAYLDEWMHAASNNVTVLRNLVGIVSQSRTDMNILWDEYNRELQKAKTIDGGEGFKTYWQLWKSWDDAKKDEAINDINHVQEVYNGRARTLAYKVGGEYFTTFSRVSNGFGPPFRPMNAVLNDPGHKPWRMPGAPPGMAGLNAPPVSVTPPMAPPALATQTPPSLTPPPALELTPPGVDTPDPSTLPDPATNPGTITQPPGGVGIPPGQLSNVPIVALPPGTGLATPPPGFGGGNAPITSPGTGLGNVTSPSLPPGSPSMPPGGLRNGVFNRKGGLNKPSFSGGDPQAAIRAPGTPPPAGTPSQRRPGAHGDNASSPPNSHVTESDEGFGRPPSPTAPPVLNNQRPGQERRDRSSLMPPGARSNHLGTPTPGAKSAAPPVLNSPASNPATPAPTRGTQPPGTPGRSQSERGREKARPAVNVGIDWTGTEEVRAGTSAPILDAPALPVSGSAVSRLEEVPKRLRSSAAGQPGARAVRGGAVAPELSSRHAKADAPRAEKDDDELAVVTDEQAFTVETPGGEVLAKQREQTGYKAEPPTALKAH